MNRVDETATAAFEQDGAVCLRQRDWIDELAAGVGVNYASPSDDGCRYTPEDGPGGFYDDDYNWQRIPRDATIEFVAGSHRWGKQFMPRKLKDRHDYADQRHDGFDPLPEIEGNSDRYDRIGWELEVGDCVVFHMRTQHGAAGTHHLRTQRRALSTRWRGDDARFARRPFETSTTFRGPDLESGAAIYHPLFPCVWPRAASASPHAARGQIATLHSADAPKPCRWLQVVFLLALLLSTLDAAASTAIAELQGKVITVLGPIPPEELGITLTHEHLFIDFSLPLAEPERWADSYRREMYPDTPERLRFWELPVELSRLASLRLDWSANRDVLVLDSASLAARELSYYAAAGGESIVDVTSIGLGRNPTQLRELAYQTNLNIVMGASWYKDAWRPDAVRDLGIEELTDHIVEEFVAGVDRTGIRPGIIGEVGAEDYAPDNPLSDQERNVLRASARAAIITGAPMSVHTWWEAGQQVTVPALIEREGLDPSRVAISHIHGGLIGDQALLRDLAARGYYLSFDVFGAPFANPLEGSDDARMAQMIADLAARGHASRILISQDVCTKLQLRHYGGFGYAFVLEHVVPRLLELGVTESQVEEILIANPRSLLTFDPPGKPAALDD